MPATFGNGKICYIELPANDIAQSAEFYKNVFGWTIRTRGDGATAFDDGVGEVSGTWILGRPASENPGLLVYIMVADAAAASAAITAARDVIVKPVDPAEHETFAHFRDPAGNVLGIYQEP